MATNTIDAIFQLRRDNDYNFEAIKDTFIPKYGEPVLVDTATNGLRLKIGDGIHTYAQIAFIDNAFFKGYLYNGIFYEDLAHTTVIPGYEHKFYISKSDNAMYYFDGTNYLSLSGTVTPSATPTIPGIMKLYGITGQNIDGTMTQKAITEELNTKFEVDINTSEEMLIFTK